MHRCRSSRLLRPQPSHQIMPARSWICSVSRCRLRRIQRANMCGHSSPPVFQLFGSGMPVLKMKFRKPTLAKEFPRLQMCGDCLVKNAKNGWRDEKTESQLKGAADCSHTSCWPCDDPIFIAPSWFSAPPGLTLPVGSRPDYWLNELWYRGGDTEKHPGPQRALRLRGQGILVQVVLPTTAQPCDVVASESEKYLRVRDIHGLEQLVNHGLNELGHAGIQHLRGCFASGSLGPGQAGTLISGLKRHVLLARSCGADLEDHQIVFRTLWRVYRSWSLAIPAEFRTPVSHEIVLSVATFAWLHCVPELSLLTLLSFHCLLRPAETRQLRWCDVKNVKGSLSTRYEKVHGIIHIREPKTRRMAGRAAQQHVLLECPGICQLVHTMKSSIPDHRLDTAIWKFTAAQHFAHFQRRLRSHGVSHQHYTLSEAVELPIIAFNTAFDHNHDAEVGGL